MPLLAQLQQGWLIRFAIDACQAGDCCFSQSRLSQDLPDHPLHQRQAGVAFTAHPQPEAGGMPAAGGLVGGANAQLCLARTGHALQRGMLVLPIGGTRGLGDGQPFRARLLLHQLPPGGAAATAPPAPALTEGIQRQAILCGTGSGQDGAGLQHPCQFPRPLLSTTAVAPQQGDDPPSLRIQHENGWIPLLALDQRGDQPGHSTNRADE